MTKIIDLDDGIKKEYVLENPQDYGDEVEEYNQEFCSRLKIEISIQHIVKIVDSWNCNITENEARKILGYLARELDANYFEDIVNSAIQDLNINVKK